MQKILSIEIYSATLPDLRFSKIGKKKRNLAVLKNFIIQYTSIISANARKQIDIALKK